MLPVDIRLVMRMQSVNRRRFLQLAGGTVATTMLSDSIARALAIPANRATRSLEDVEHIVFLMQENRAFDHYYGVMRGVRGFGDPHPVALPNGKPIWRHPRLVRSRPRSQEYGPRAGSATASASTSRPTAPASTSRSTITVGWVFTSRHVR